MGKRGPKPTPTKTLERRGSPVAKERVGEPTPDSVRLTPPAWLSDEAREHFDRLAAHYHAMEILGGCDVTAVALLAESLAEYIAAREEVKRAGRSTESATGTVMVHPAVGARNKAHDQVVKLLREFGGTPSSRVGLRLAAEKPKGIAPTGFTPQLAS